VTQSKYFLAAAKRFSKYLVGKKFPSTPLPESRTPEEGSDADRAEARGLPYRELSGVLAYPSTYVKLEIRLAISLLSRYLHAPTKEHFKMGWRFSFLFSDQHFLVGPCRTTCHVLPLAHFGAISGVCDGGVVRTDRHNAGERSGSTQHYDLKAHHASVGGW
jgi:hypothetical protein